MNEQHMRGIKSRHQAGYPIIYKDSSDGEIKVKSMVDGEIGTFSESAEEIWMWVRAAHDDRDELIRELERFKSNFEVGLELIDGFVDHYANTLPKKAKEQLRHLQVRLWGLL